jgi:hypothetical protein
LVAGHCVNTVRRSAGVAYPVARHSSRAAP